ncbi:MAG TPA: MarR family winged helix-turn-helix transcriptional regulator [Candidatus Paceibacterota bacterium]|nr:MarR family winged helix-turn-helix transcriptional regulator [Candidatus Paceibacterota bacterium]
MAKKRKKEKEGFDAKAYNLSKLKDLQTKGRYLGTSKTRHHYYGSLKFPIMRYRKFYVPKWVYKIKTAWLQSTYIDYHEKHDRFPNNEERILAQIHPFSRNSVKQTAKETAIDYKNISRYLKKMEKKGLITIEQDYSFKTMKSGTLKYIYYKNILITKKGKDLYLKLYERDF